MNIIIHLRTHLHYLYRSEATAAKDKANGSTITCNALYSRSTTVSLQLSNELAAMAGREKRTSHPPPRYCISTCCSHIDAALSSVISACFSLILIKSVQNGK
uniref:Uncharacterized protein n=1 Tax=Ascaris lumbricoides TaxID=6252 RepID=A0A9J2P1P3_ASCLU